MVAFFVSFGVVCVDAQDTRQTAFFQARLVNLPGEQSCLSIGSMTAVFEGCSDAILFLASWHSKFASVNIARQSF